MHIHIREIDAPKVEVFCELNIITLISFNVTSNVFAR